MSINDREAPKEIAEREAQELFDILSELIEKAEALKLRLNGNSNRDSNSLGGTSSSFQHSPIVVRLFREFVRNNLIFRNLLYTINEP